MVVVGVVVTRTRVFPIGIVLAQNLTACYSGFVQNGFESLISFYRGVIVPVMQIKKNTSMKLN